MKKLLIVTVITFAPFIVSAYADGITGEALAYACAGNVPGATREKNTADYVKFCNTYITGWDDARFAFLQGTRTYCPPNITSRETSIVFFDYVATHETARKLPAAEASAEVLQK